MTPAEIVSALSQRGQTLSCAESLTGGLLSDAFVSVPGASRVFMGGIVSYDEGRKVSLLGVKPETLQKHTAVSRETCLEMCRGAKNVIGTDYALSTTGYAGPDGEEVGLVYVGLASPEGETCIECRFCGSRSDIRHAAVQAAVRLLYEALDPTE